MEAKMFKLGMVTLTLQALVVFLLGILLALVAFALFPNVYGLVAAIGILVLFGFYTYIVNCLIVGKCVVLSWIIVGIYVFIVLTMIGNLTILKRGLKQIKKSKK
jgi:hypothetical protein